MTTAAIIGSGVSALGKNWGSAIDATDFVIRMHDCGWQNPDDYGTRHDAGFLIVNTLTPRRDGAPKEWWAALAHEKFRDELPRISKYGAISFLLDATALSAESKRLTPDAPDRVVVSKGVLAAIAAIRSGRFDGLILIGFDNLYNGRVTKSAYSRLNSARHGKRVNERWDCIADRNLLHATARDSNIGLEFWNDL